MEPSAPLQVGKFLVIAGAVIVIAGLLVMAGAKFNILGLGRLPGDITYKGKHISIYFPIVTSIVLSVGLTLLLWIISMWTRK